MVTFNNEELQVMLKLWVERMKLQEWDIRASIIRGKDFILGDSCGEVNFLLSKAQATIHLLDPIDYPSDTAFEQDMEVTLVHELLHLKFAAFQPEEGTLKHDLFERAIQTTAEFLVGMRREIVADKTKRIVSGESVREVLL